MITLSKRILPVLLVALLFANCKKEDAFLDAKPNQSLIVPSGLNDYEKLFSNEYLFNRNTDPHLGTVTADEFSLTEVAFINLSSNTARNLYVWQSDVYESEPFGDNQWNAPYQQIYCANTVLEGMERMSVSAGQQEQYNRIKGMALFFRSWAFYNLLQTYALPYDAGTSSTDPGIPLKVNTSLTEKVVRATVKEGYDLIIKDLLLAVSLLPAQSNFKTLPSALAAKGLLARVFLGMSSYEKAYQYANAYLIQDSQLSDYNSLTPTNTAIHSSFLLEDKFHTYANTMISRSNAIVDPVLVASYANGDLRKDLFFRLSGGNYLFRGFYDYSGNQYTGIATDEIYLIRAECLARAGNAADALKDLNGLLAKRWKTGVVFTPLQAVNADEALIKILTERRKELLFRGLRWTDLRRLNKEDRFKTTLSRTINGITYTLPPNDRRYALPIPKSEIDLTGMPQNQR